MSDVSPTNYGTSVEGSSPVDNRTDGLGRRKRPSTRDREMGREGVGVTLLPSEGRDVGGGAVRAERVEVSPSMSQSGSRTSSRRQCRL